MKNKRKKIITRVKVWIKVSLAFAVIGLAGLLSVKIVIDIENSKLLHFENKMICGLQPETDRVNVTYLIPVRSDGQKNCWQQDDGSWGAQYDFYISNNTSATVKQWCLNLSLSDNARIDSSWNGVFIQNEGNVSVTSTEEASNTEIIPTGNVKVGFVLYTDELLDSIDFTLVCKLYKNFFENFWFVFFLCLSGLSLLTFAVCVILYFLLKKQSAASDAQIMELIKLCARFIDTRDQYTRMHSAHVAEYSKQIAKVMGKDAEFQEHIFFLGMLHDIGKVLIPREILCKPARLDDEEWEEMKLHTLYGAEVLEDFNGVENIREAALYHHERFDGNGYIFGLKGEEIPLEARIICVADAFDAMATDRSYRKHLSKEKILEELEKARGLQFDPEVADAMIKLINTNEIPC